MKLRFPRRAHPFRNVPAEVTFLDGGGVVGTTIPREALPDGRTR